MIVERLIPNEPAHAHHSFSIEFGNAKAKSPTDMAGFNKKNV